MALISILYVSQSTIAQHDAEATVAQIVAEAEIYNTKNGLTGALLFTGAHFAQLLEGQADEVDRLMDLIRRDPRHTRLNVVNRGPIVERSFGDWTMAYFGPSRIIGRYVARLLKEPTEAEQRRASAWLEEIIREFPRSAT